MASRFEVFTAAKIQVRSLLSCDALRVVLRWNNNTTQLHNPEDYGSMVIRSVGILPQQYTASEPRRSRHVDSSESLSTGSVFGLFCTGATKKHDRTRAPDDCNILLRRAREGVTTDGCYSDGKSHQLSHVQGKEVSFLVSGSIPLCGNET